MNNVYRAHIKKKRNHPALSQRPSRPLNMQRTKAFLVHSYLNGATLCILLVQQTAVHSP